MGTSNFHRVNASKVFAVLMNQPALDDDGSETGDYYAPDEWEIDEFFEYLREQLAKNTTFFPGGSDPHELSSFPSRVIGEIRSGTDFAGGLISGRITITAVMRSGYYEGACLDWHITKSIDGDEYDDVSEYDGGANDFTEVEAECARFDIEGWFWSEEKRLIEFVEGVFAQASMPMEVVATFSNGETIYKTAN